MYLAGGRMPQLLGTVVFALFTLIFTLSPFVSARDLDTCPLGYSSCSGIKDYAPVCCKWSGPVRSGQAQVRCGNEFLADETICALNRSVRLRLPEVARWICLLFDAQSDRQSRGPMLYVVAFSSLRKAKDRRADNRNVSLCRRRRLVLRPEQQSLADLSARRGPRYCSHHRHASSRRRRRRPTSSLSSFSSSA